MDDGSVDEQTSLWRDLVGPRRGPESPGVRRGRRVATVGLTLLAVAVAVGMILLAQSSRDDDWPLNVLIFPLGIGIGGGVLAIARVTRIAGWIVIAVAVWAFCTWYGLVSIVDPYEAISDSLSHPGGKGPDLDSVGEARFWGAFFLLIVNVPVVLLAWALLAERLQRGRRRE